jgi:protein-disulfide isomerase
LNPSNPKGVFVVQLIRRLALLLLLLCLGCSAQSNAGGDANRRIERMVRNHFTLPPTFDVNVTDRAASKDFPQFDQVTVKLSRGTQTTNRQFLISKDGQKLYQMTQVVDPLDKMDLSNRPWRGNKDAKVTIVNYDDFQCPFCARNHSELMNSILKAYGDRVKIVYKDFPLIEIHPWAMRAAVDSNCLAAQSNDAYWDYADYVHANQREIGGAPPALPDKPTPEQQKAAHDKSVDASFERLDKAATDTATKRGLNTAKLEACMKTQDSSLVQASRKEGDDLGINATPTMYINGEKIDGVAPDDALRAMIDRALKDAGQPAPAAPPAAGQTSKN